MENKFIHPPKQKLLINIIKHYKPDYIYNDNEMLTYGITMDLKLDHIIYSHGGFLPAITREEIDNYLMSI